MSLQPSTTPSLPIVHPCIRDFSSAHTQQPAAPAQREQKIDPYALLDDDLKDIFEDVRQVSGKFCACSPKNCNKSHQSTFLCPREHLYLLNVVEHSRSNQFRVCPFRN